MVWYYRIIKHKTSNQNHFALHEVFYDDDGNIISWTEQPIDIIGESKADIKRALKQMLLDIETEVITESELLKNLK